MLHLQFGVVLALAIVVAIFAPFHR
jgi:hypothetical protein